MRGPFHATWASGAQHEPNLVAQLQQEDALQRQRVWCRFVFATSTAILAFVATYLASGGEPPGWAVDSERFDEKHDETKRHHRQVGQ